MPRLRCLVVAPLLLTSLVLSGCASTERAVREMAAGSCQVECADAHEDSLYDEQRCLDRCQPPEE